MSRAELAAMAERAARDNPTRLVLIADADGRELLRVTPSRAESCEVWVVGAPGRPFEHGFQRSGRSRSEALAEVAAEMRGQADAEIRRMTLERCRPGTIARRLNASAIVPPSGRKWSANKVRAAQCELGLVDESPRPRARREPGLSQGKASVLPVG